MRTAGRFLIRALWLAFEVIVAASRFIFLLVRTGGNPTLCQRSECLQRGCRRTVKVFLKEIAIRGTPPKHGLLISNHLSYVDILLLGSISPTVFVSKAEVKDWPVFGWFSRLSSTVFVQRERRGEVGKIAEQIQSLLRDSHLVVLFPEGTSSDGETVLPFKSALLEPVVGWQNGIHTSAISYRLEGGDARNDVCYWGDMTFFPHAMKLLCKPRAEARVTFAPVIDPANDRKQLARQLHAQVVALKEQRNAVPADTGELAKSF